MSGACPRGRALLLLLLLVVGRTGALPLHLMALLPPGDPPGLARALRKAVSDFDAGLVEKEVALSSSVVSVGAPDPQGVVDPLCGALEKRVPAVLLSFLGPELSLYASLVAGYARIPLLDVSRGYRNKKAESVNPYYLSPDPRPEDLAEAAGRFLLSNSWNRAIVIRDDSSFSEDFTRQLKRFTSTPKNNSSRGVEEMLVPQHFNDSMIFQVVADVPRSQVRVLLVACGPDTAQRVVKQAAKASLLDGQWIWIMVESAFNPQSPSPRDIPVGALGLRLRPRPLDRTVVRSVVQLVAGAAGRTGAVRQWLTDPNSLNYTAPVSCWFEPEERRRRFAKFVHRLVRNQMQRSPPPVFDIYNLVPASGLMPHHVSEEGGPRSWKQIGDVTGTAVNLDTVLWTGGSRRGPSSVGRRRFRVVTAYAPPFVKPATRVANGSCLAGQPCLQVWTNSKRELSRLFADFRGHRSLEGVSYNVSCCAGISIDLLHSLSRDLFFDVDLYLVADGFFGTRKGKRWNGVTLDVMSGAAHMAVSAFSVTRERARVLDYSVPFHHSGVSCLTFTKERDVPLSAFLVPFSVQLWVAIFLCLNITAVCAATYEWLSPFGLNPWGRQRSKNFSLASALWVMWSLLFSHLVAFKAPKSWPNKVLINLWGCFSVIFVSSYTANIAAHFAGLFFHLRVDDFHDASLLNQRTGTTKSTSAESYIYAENAELWQHIQKYGFASLDEGLQKLRRGELDVLIGDTVVLDYFRGNDPGCALQMLGQSIFEDAYAVGMRKGFRLREAISQLILRYNEHGFMEQLQKKWFGRAPCFNHSVHRLSKPKPLSLSAVAGVFVMLGVGLLAGIVILVIEHLVFKHALPQLRRKPADCFWKSPNLMFFSQKLYRFINTVELVSPHHSAKEIVTNIREGQIFSLFQKSVKRKAKEEARRRKSKSQFFEMIQEIRNVVRLQKEQRRKHPELVPSTQPQLISPEVTTPLCSPLDRQRLIFVPPTSSSSPRNWTSFYRKGPQLFSSGQTTRYSHLQQCQSSGRLGSPPTFRPRRVCDSPSSSSGGEEPTKDQSGFDTTILSISVEDLRLVQTAQTSSQRVKRHRSLDESLLKRTPVKDKQRKDRVHPSDHRTRVKKLLEADELFLYSMSKEDIVQSWRASERRLLNKLRDTIKEKRSLERKLVFIQKTLVKPP